MHAVAPGLIWHWEGPGFWEGVVPLWPFHRAQPPGWTSLVDHKPFNVQIVCSHAHPMIDPTVWPVAIKVPVAAIGSTDWHLLPSGALCLLRDRTSWQPSELASDLVKKTSSWYIEYHLMRAGYIRRMTDYGIANDTSLDGFLREIGKSSQC